MNIKRFLFNKSTVLIVLIFIVTFLFSSYFARFDIDPHHDGLMFKPALDVSQGKKLFSETFTMYGPLSTYIQVLSIKILGSYVISLRMATAFFYSLIAVLLFMIWSKLMPQKYSLIIVLIYLALAPYLHQIYYPWSSVYALFFTMCTIYFFIQSFKNGKKKSRSISFHPVFILLSGISSCLAFLSKQPYIIITISFIIFYFSLFLLNIKLKSIIYYIFLFLLGFFASYFLFVFFMYLYGLVLDYFKQSLWLGYILGRILGGIPAITNELIFFKNNPIWLLIPLSSLYVFLFSFRKILSNKWAQENIKVFGFSLISLVSLLNYYPVADASHAYWAATPSMGFLVYALYINKKNLFTNFNKNIFFKNIILISIFLIYFFVFIQYFIVEKSHLRSVRKFYTYTTNPVILKGIPLTREDSLYYKELSNLINNYLKNYPNKYFINNTPDGLYSALANRSQSIGPMYINFSGYTSGIYPYDDIFNHLIKTDKPLILIQKNLMPYIKGYYVLFYSDRDEGIVLMAPIDDRK